MAGSLVSTSNHWIDDTSAAEVLTMVQLVETSTPGEYTFARRGRRPAGSLVTDGAGGYVVTLGVMSGAGILARRESGDIIIF